MRAGRRLRAESHAPAPKERRERALPPRCRPNEVADDACHASSSRRRFAPRRREALRIETSEQ